MIYLGKKSQPNGNPFNWIVVITEGNRRQANIPDRVYDTRGCRLLQKDEKGSDWKSSSHCTSQGTSNVGAVLAYDSLRRFAVRETAPKGESTDILLAAFRTYVDGKSLRGELMVPTRCEKDANEKCSRHYPDW